MTLNEYEDAAVKTMAASETLDDGVICCSLGLTGEAGEVADYIKKVIYHGHTIHIDKLVKELGDVLWYIAAMAHTIGVPMEQIAQANIDKLAARYPGGFSSEKSINRVEEK